MMYGNDIETNNHQNVTQFQVTVLEGYSTHDEIDKIIHNEELQQQHQNGDDNDNDNDNDNAKDNCLPPETILDDVGPEDIHERPNRVNEKLASDLDLHQQTLEAHKCCIHHTDAVHEFTDIETSILKELPTDSDSDSDSDETLASLPSSNPDGLVSNPNDDPAFPESVAVGVLPKDTTTGILLHPHLTADVYYSLFVRALGIAVVALLVFVVFF